LGGECGAELRLRLLLLVVVMLSLLWPWSEEIYVLPVTWRVMPCAEQMLLFAT
jgi:hypothetical protein